MRTYLILKEKARRFDEDREIQEILAEIGREDEDLAQAMSAYSSESVQRLREADLDRRELARRRLPYERLDQLTVELLMGVR